MSKIPKGDSLQKTSNKNIKNIYVHKINSLMKISRENLGTDDIQIIHNAKGAQKKIKKIYSEVDKATLKLEKNRQSARKARQRKNLYIKLLENQVTFLKRQLAQSETVQLSSEKYLGLISSTSKPTYKHSHSPTVEDDLDKYISQENVADAKQSKQRDERKTKKLDDILSEYKHWFVPDLLKNITTLKKQQRLDLNAKMLKNAESQHHKIPVKNNNHYTINNHTHHNHHEFHKAHEIPLHLLLPFEEDNPQQKISSVVKNLGKNSEQVKTLLENLDELNKQIKQLIAQQESTDIQAEDMARKRIRSIVQQLRLCNIGDRPQKIIERIMRWGEFPSISMNTTMHKIVELNNFIENTYVEENQIQQIKERAEQSEMSEEKQPQKQLQRQPQRVSKHK